MKWHAHFILRNSPHDEEAAVFVLLFTFSLRTNDDSDDNAGSMFVDDCVRVHDDDDDDGGVP